MSDRSLSSGAVETIARSPLHRPIPLWRCCLPVLVQLALVLSIPSQAFYTLVTGKTVILQTQPVDPYDWLRGYSQTLSYDISRWETLQKLPGWDELSANSHQLSRGFYVILQQPEETHSTVPTPWQAIAITASVPTQLPPTQIALRGRSHQGQLIYGLETYYMPEDQRTQINQEIITAQQLENQPFVVEIKVDSQGRSVPVTLWINEQPFQVGGSPNRS